MTIDDDQSLQPKPVATPVRAQVAATVESTEKGSHDSASVQHADEGKGEVPAPLESQDSTQSEMKQESKTDDGDSTSVVPKKGPADDDDDDVEQDPTKEINRKA